LFKYEREKIVGQNGKLKKWLNSEIVKQENGWDFASIYFEYDICGGENGSNKKYVTLENNDGYINITGKVDRIELHKISDDAEKYFLIADYKLSSNSIKKLSDINSGKSFQIPLYLLALEKIFAKDRFVPSVGVYYIVNKKDSESYEKVVLCNEDITSYNKKNKSKNATDVCSIIAKSLEFAIDNKNQIENLQFALTDDTKNCHFCEYKNMCQINM
jgi:ATP-dependent helicase/DNAse subunit B